MRSTSGRALLAMPPRTQQEERWAGRVSRRPLLVRTRRLQRDSADARKSREALAVRTRVPLAGCLSGQLRQHSIPRKSLLNPSWIAAQLLMDHRFARRTGKGVFEIINNLLVGRDR